MTMSKVKGPERRGCAPHSRLLTPRAAVTAGVLLAALAIVGAFNGRINGVLDEDVSAGTPLDPAAPRPKTPERPDPRLYMPPSEHGVIVRPFESFGGGKRIIYVVDEHPMDMSNATALRSQREIYFLLRDMIAKFGQVPVVLENLPIGVTAADMAAMPAEAKAKMDMDDTGTFVRVFGTSNLGERRMIAEEMVGKSLMPAGMLAMGAHREIIPIGSTTPDEAALIGRQLFDQEALMHALAHRDEVPCDDRGRLNLDLASSAFERGDRLPSVVACYCGVRAQMEGVVSEFLRDRYELAPRREISAAAGYPGDFVVVIAGLHHLHRSMELMKDNGLGFTVVAPRSLEGRFPEAFGPPGRPVTLLDDEAGTCAGYEAAAVEQLRRQQAEALMKWMMEE